MMGRLLAELYARLFYLLPEPNKDARRRHLEHMRALRDMDRIVLAHPDLQPVTDALLETVAGLFPRSAAAIWLLDETTGRLEPAAWRNFDEPEWKPAAAIGNIAAEGRPSMITTVGTWSNSDAARLLRDHGFAVGVGIPLLSRNETMGVLGVYDNRCHAFSEEEVEFLTTLANRAALALQNGRLYRRTLEQSSALRQANEALERFNHTTSDLLSIMSHEFRTPLNLIVGYAMLKEGSLEHHRRARESHGADFDFVGRFAGPRDDFARGCGHRRQRRATEA
jgi:GAF domain-containing protein